MAKRFLKGGQQQPIEICFRDEQISFLFAQLIQASGERVKIIDDIARHNPATKVITEPLYFPQLEADQHRQCLVVGPEPALEGIDAMTLPQPLTEESVEKVLDAFLKG